MDFHRRSKKKTDRKIEETDVLRNFKANFAFIFQQDSCWVLNISYILISFEIIFVSMKSNTVIVSSKGDSVSSCAVR